MAEVSKILRKLLACGQIFALAAFLLDLARRRGQNIGIRANQRPQEVTDDRHDSGELQQGRRVDAEYQTRIRAMDDAIRIRVTKDHEPFCRSSEELRRRSFDTLKAAVPSQRHDVHV